MTRRTVTISVSDRTWEQILDRFGESIRIYPTGTVQLSWHERKLYRELEDFVDPDGWVTGVTQTGLASFLGWSQSTVSHRLDVLERAGAISIFKAGKGRTDSYRLHGLPRAKKVHLRAIKTA